MARATANGIELEYQTFGSPDDPPLLLICGLGQQLTAYPEELCRALADSGLWVIRYDNRDSGLSSGAPENAPRPDWQAIVTSDHTSATYRIADLADDAAGLLDALGIASAHVAGVSMGGMIAQQLAIARPDLVRSLCSIMSTTGDRSVGRPTPEAGTLLFAPSQHGRAAAIAQRVRALAFLSSPQFPTPEAELRTYVESDYDRANRPLGTSRQLAAVMTSPDRTQALTQLDLPTLVIHGEADPLVDPSGGRATAAAIPGARLLLIPGMAHDLPRQLWPTFVKEIAALTRTADGLG